MRRATALIISLSMAPLALAPLAACGGPLLEDGNAPAGKADSLLSHQLVPRYREARRLPLSGYITTTAEVLAVDNTPGEASVTIETDPLLLTVPPDQALTVELPAPWAQGVVAANRAFLVGKADGSEWGLYPSEYFKEATFYDGGAFQGEHLFFDGSTWFGEDVAVRRRASGYDMGSITLSMDGRELAAEGASREFKLSVFPVAKWGEWATGMRFGTTVSVTTRCVEGRLTIANEGSEPAVIEVQHQSADGWIWTAVEGVVEAGASADLRIDPARRLRRVCKSGDTAFSHRTAFEATADGCFDTWSLSDC